MCLYVPISFAQGIQYTETIEDWVFEKNLRPNSQEIDHCLIKNRYDNGTVFILAQNPAGIYRLALHFPHENLKPRQSYKLDLIVDDQKPLSTMAVVATPSILAIVLPSHPTLIEDIARGNILTMQGPKDIVQFQLKGTANAIRQLKNCAVKTTQSVPPTPEFPSWLQTILVQMDMTDIKPIFIDNNQNLPLDFAWVTPNIFGGTKTIPYDKTNTTAKQIMDQYLGAIRQLCPGNFLYDTLNKKSVYNTEFIPYDIVCSTQEEDTITSLLFTIEEEMMTVFFFEGDAQGEALKKRDQLLNIISQ